VATKFGIFDDGAELENGLVPAVDPADLRSVWAMQNDFQSVAPGGRFAIDADL
jgi:hypothetical protein